MAEQFTLAEAFAEVKLRGRSQFEQGLGSIESRLRRTQKQMDGLARASRRMLAVEALLFGLAIRQAATFEASMSRVKALTEATTGEFRKLTTEARKLGATTQFTASQSAQAMGEFAKAGFDTTKILASMRPTLDLAAAGEIELGRAAEITAKIMAGMQIPVSDLTHTVDVLAAAATSSQTDIIELGTAMRFVGSIGRSSGRELEDVVAVLQALANQSFAGQVGGAALRNMLGLLAQESSGVKKTFGGMNVAIKTTAGQVRPLADIIDDFNAALEAQGRTAEATGLVMQAFGQRAGPAFAALLGAGGDSIRAFRKDLNDVAGTASRIAQVKLDNLKGSFIELKSAVEAMAITIGGTFKEELRDAVKFLRDMAQAVSEMDVNTKEGIKAWAEYAAILGVVTIAASNLLKIATPLMLISIAGTLKAGAAGVAAGGAVGGVGGLAALGGALGAQAARVNPAQAAQAGVAVLPVVARGGKAARAFNPPFKQNVLDPGMPFRRQAPGPLQRFPAAAVPATFRGNVLIPAAAPRPGVLRRVGAAGAAAGAGVGRGIGAVAPRIGGAIAGLASGLTSLAIPIAGMAVAAEAATLTLNALANPRLRSGEIGFREALGQAGLKQFAGLGIELPGGQGGVGALRGIRASAERAKRAGTVTLEAERALRDTKGDRQERAAIGQGAIEELQRQRGRIEDEQRLRGDTPALRRESQQITNTIDRLNRDFLAVGIALSPLSDQIAKSEKRFAMLEAQLGKLQIPEIGAQQAIDAEGLFEKLGHAIADPSIGISERQQQIAADIQQKNQALQAEVRQARERLAELRGRQGESQRVAVGAQLAGIAEKLGFGPEQAQALAQFLKERQEAQSLTGRARAGFGAVGRGLAGAGRAIAGAAAVAVMAPDEAALVRQEMQEEEAFGRQMLADEDRRAAARNFEADQAADLELKRKLKEINEAEVRQRTELRERGGGGFGFRGAGDVARDIQQKIFAGDAQMLRIQQNAEKQREKAQDERKKQVVKLGEIAVALQNPPAPRWP